jgi:hypothetical protein
MFKVVAIAVDGKTAESNRAILVRAEYLVAISTETNQDEHTVVQWY